MSSEPSVEYFVRHPTHVYSKSRGGHLPSVKTDEQAAAWKPKDPSIYPKGWVVVKKTTEVVSSATHS